ncbi:uncharacterized protein TNCV_1531911 [Trichonephila clavipes]|nr:uncharacterized protein TNCV_1531911 [Trichonephila clavipes]
MIFSEESRFSLSADVQRIRMWMSPVQSNICCRGVYSDYTRCDRMGSDLLGHTITSSRLSSHFDGTHPLDHILTPAVLPMLSSHPGAFYQQDNACPYTMRLSQQCFQG